MSVCEYPRKNRGILGLSAKFLTLAGSFAVFAVLVSIWTSFAPSSGHAASNFDRWVKGFWPKAKAAGISWSTYRAAFRGVTPDRDVLKKASHQPEFKTFIGDYVARRVGDRRIGNGREQKQEWNRWLARIERKYGVDRHIVLAIWGLESAYGRVLDNPRIVKGTIRSLATLAYRGGRRARYGRQQLLAALKILQRGDVSPRRMTGSWAGAMGHTQFIPTTYNAYAVDIDGDGRRNIWTSVPDALASTANYLKKAGWESGKTWGYEVILPRTFDFRIADRGGVRTLGQWQQLGIMRPRGRRFPRPSDKARLFMPAGANGPAFLLLKNFRVIKRYNNADAYALAVGHLADRLRGGGGFHQNWPTGEIRLAIRHRREIQKLLSRKGYRVGDIDGKLGSKTKSAIRGFQKRNGLIADGHPSMALIKRLRSDR